jgi:hypothetical protein
MRFFVITMTLALFLFITLIYHTEHFANPPMLQQDFSDEGLIRPVIQNAPAPAGTDQTGRLIYSNTDLQANIVNVEEKIKLMNMNTPQYVREEVAAQLAAKKCV